MEPAARDCGAHHLKLNSLRWLLHDETLLAEGSAEETSQLAAGGKVLEEVLASFVEVLEQAQPHARPPLRWELAVTWAQYLKEPPTEGPGAVPPARNTIGGAGRGPGAPLVLAGGSDEGEAALKAELGEETWKPIAKLGIGLHRLSPKDITTRATQW